jgi:hypothetical protein
MQNCGATPTLKIPYHHTTVQDVNRIINVGLQSKTLDNQPLPGAAAGGFESLFAAAR